jgi:two-component system nitrogen regulation sensor histidine kinase GlnL
MDIFYRQILDNLSTALLWVDAHLRLQWINPAAEALLEFSENQAVGQQLAVVFPCVRQMQQVLQQQTVLTEYGVELDLPTGTHLTLNCTITPIFTGQSIQALLIELVQADQQLLLSHENETVSQTEANHLMIRGLAHEIKNPLGGVRGAAQLLARALPDDSLREYTDVIITEADRLRSLVDRLSGPQMLPQKRLENIHRLLCRVSRLLQSKQPELNIKQDFDPSIPELMIDSDQIYQVLLNLMQNGVQAMENQVDKKLLLISRIHRHMVLSKQYHRLCLRVDIKDNGCGIDPQLLPKIFYPMVTGRAKGMGLGLSIAQNLAQQNGGIIHCKSKTGETVFSLWLPLPL